jgi:hypothetical protein
MQRNDKKALIELHQADLQAFPLFHLVGAVISAELGMTAEATQEGETFSRLRPDFPPNVKAELAKRNIPPEDQVRMITGMRKVGLAVPADPSERLSPPPIDLYSQPATDRGARDVLHRLSDIWLSPIRGFLLNSDFVGSGGMCRLFPAP